MDDTIDLKRILAEHRAWLQCNPASPNLPFESIRFETIEVAYTEENWQ